MGSGNGLAMPQMKEINESNKPAFVQRPKQVTFSPVTMTLPTSNIISTPTHAAMVTPTSGSPDSASRGSNGSAYPMDFKFQAAAAKYFDRKERNRLSARRSRMRKKEADDSVRDNLEDAQEKMRELEFMMVEKDKTIEHLTQQKQELDAFISHLRQENGRLLNLISDFVASAGSNNHKRERDSSSSRMEEVQSLDERMPKAARVGA